MILTKHMKDTLILEHKIYISAKRAVQISGYTSDYVGQLCRAGKLDCKMVGKFWFLTEESLISYKLSTKQESGVEEAKKVAQDASAILVKSESIILDRMNFISAKRAAEVSGYTADYVGQLCRSGKLESRRVGTAWFVSEKSLLNHCVISAQESSLEVQKIEVAPKAVEVISPVITPVETVKSSVANITDSTKINYVPVISFKNNKTNIISLSYFTKLSFGAAISVIVLMFLLQSIFVPVVSTPKTANSSASVIMAIESFGSKIFSFFTAIPRLAISIFTNNPDQIITTKIDGSPPTTPVGLAVIPSTGSHTQDELMKQTVRSAFSDEVKVKPDGSGTAGVITPVFKKAEGKDFVYVMVPAVKNQ